MRPSIMSAVLFTALVAPGNATNIWLSPSGVSSAPPADPSEIPEFPRSGTLYVWGQVDPGQTLWQWTLNIHTGRPGAVNFTGVNVLNPKLGETDDGTREIRRYVFTESGTLQADGQSIQSFEGRQVLSLVIGVGLGPDAKPVDPFYDDENDSWLLAEIFYEKAGEGTTDLWLQIGPAGLHNRGQTREETDVVFGALTDPALNGDTGREQDSATPEAHIVPEPSAGLLMAVGVIGLIGFTRGWRRNARNTTG